MSKKLLNASLWIGFLLFGSLLILDCSERTFVTIGTGAVTGVYYPTGGAICRMINQKSGVYGIKATVESTAGSVYNVNAVLSGDLDFGIVQSDRQYQAVHGEAEWAEKGAQKALRSVFSIHAESVTLVASVKSGILDVDGLRGKRVNIGNPGSGTLQNARDALRAFGLSEDDVQAEYIKAIEAPSLLQDERIDAFFYTVGHPSGAIKEVTSGRIQVHLIPIVGSAMDDYIQNLPYYTKTRILKKHYPKAVNDGDADTFGVRSTLVTSESVPADIVYAITKEIFDHLETFRALHPAYEDLTRESMLTGLSAPIHRGALRYYEESGLINMINTKLTSQYE
ncbi:TAXI family TRAP transporter solute-binding subunit [bacterium]|nr:TAXI family TRAP transporter solute-binding subunit [bacterium]